MGLIDKLKLQHIQILNLLDEARALGVSSEEGKKKLYQGKKLILEHLKLEDEQLYPQLMRMELTKNLARMFSDEMRNLSSIVIDFFDRYEKGNEDEIELAMLLGKVTANLKLRISKEETMLYKQFIEFEGKESA